MQYTTELKDDALLMMSQGTKIAEVSQILNVPASTLYRWRSEHKPDPKPEQSAEIGELLEQITQLREQLATLEGQVREILPWIERKQRAEAKEREERECDNPDKPRLVLGRKPW